MNLLTLPSTDLEIQIHGSERSGRKAKDWQSSFHVVGLYWFSTVWSRFRIRLVHKKDEYAILLFRRSFASLLLLIGAFV
jgi:hypothetical protein